MELHTERLFIRRMQPDDWTALRRIALDFAASPYVIYDHPMPSEDQELQAVARFFSESGAVYSVIHEESGVMIGYVCLWPDKEAMDLGYCFDSAFHGKGYAYEACSAIMQYMHSVCSVRLFTSGTALDNAPSRRLLERLGFTMTGCEQISFHKDSEGNEIIFTGGRFVKEMT